MSTRLSTCTQLHKQFPAGVAKSSAAAAHQGRANYHRPAVKRPAYVANARLDADRDGTVCEAPASDFFGGDDSYDFQYCIGSGSKGIHLDVLWNDRRNYLDWAKRPHWDPDLQFVAVTQPVMGKVDVINRQETGSPDPVDHLYFSINVTDGPAAGRTPLSFTYKVGSSSSDAYTTTVTIDLNLTYC